MFTINHQESYVIPTTEVTVLSGEGLICASNGGDAGSWDENIIDRV